ncbi:MAG: metallophosphoesterase family protein [Christensenellales bacterium]|jgi:putative phosphoesterase
MRVLILSDSHGRKDNVLRALDQAGRIDAVVHAGDGGKDLPDLELPCYAVRGNCDWALELPLELEFTLDGTGFFLCHGHEFGVKRGLLRLFYRAQQAKAQYAIFGHTHKSAVLQRDGVTFINPGSIGFGERRSAPSFALLETGDKACCRIVPLE